MPKGAMKNILDYIMTASDTGIPVGHFANFIGGVAFILPAYFVYKKMGTKRCMVYGLVGGTIFLALFMSLVNYLVLLPTYSVLMNWNMTGTEIRAMVTTAIIPFNLIKGTLIAIVFMLLFSKMHGWFAKQSVLRNV